MQCKDTDMAKAAELVSLNIQLKLPNYTVLTSLLQAVLDALELHQYDWEMILYWKQLE